MSTHTIVLKGIPIFRCGDDAISDRQILEIKSLLRPDEVSIILRISKRQVYELASLGELAITQKKPLRIKSKSVLEYMDSML
ncbi:MAG: helix-turn-helix domain-containing protein [Desulfobacteraceae bacterium]|jgi:hypothetical protein